MAKVYMFHIRGVGYCVRGAKRFFDKHNFDFKDFLKNGIDAEKLELTEDAMALKVAASARKDNEMQ
jgi:hypothetical protein